MKKKQKNAGFSLVEVVLSMAILAIISIPLLAYFTDSMKYNVMMADKQHATTLAQEVAEQLKAQNKLVAKSAVAGGLDTYGVSYLTAAGYELDTSATDTLTSSTDGIGEATYYGAADKIGEKYDVKVHIDTNTTHNATGISQIYGIDDTRDALVVDDDQFQEAVVYFKAVNEAAVDSGKTGVTSKTEAEIKTDMTRTINITMNKTTTGYEVIADAEYRSTIVDSTDTVYNQNCELTSVHLKDLHAVYLLLEVSKDKDIVSITKGTGVAITPELHVICQNIDSVPAGYKLQITGDIDPAVDPAIYTNLGKNSHNGTITRNSGTPFSVQEDLVANKKEVRDADIQISVYKKGKGNTAGEEPYITVNASKGE